MEEDEKRQEEQSERGEGKPGLREVVSPKEKGIPERGSGLLGRMLLRDGKDKMKKETHPLVLTIWMMQ